MFGKYRTKTIRTGYFGSRRKIARLARKGWVEVSNTRYGYSNNIVVMRKER